MGPPGAGEHPLVPRLGSSRHFAVEMATRERAESLEASLKARPDKRDVVDSGVLIEQVGGRGKNAVISNVFGFSCAK